jgi:hypothetical protein
MGMDYIQKTRCTTGSESLRILGDKDIPCLRRGCLDSLPGVMLGPGAVAKKEGGWLS